MASDGALVKMESGRWARYQRLSVQHAGVADASPTILVAVELDEQAQDLLRAAEETAARRAPPRVGAAASMY